MFSRTRKLRRSLQRQEKTIQKQINYDFQFSQQLTNNQLLQHSINQYCKLLNSMIVTKKQKQNQFHVLSTKFEQITQNSIKYHSQDSKKHNLPSQLSKFKHEFLETQEKISLEKLVKNQLQQEITQIKKSLNLLKGDISHLVNRNQSSNLIQSKTCKVKIVADDQFEKVSSAFCKDKDEFKIKAEMQKRFKRNLKNISMFENSALKRFRNNYIELIMKKKQINERLNRLQKLSSLINTDEIQKIKDQKNTKAIKFYSCLLKLLILIDQTNKTENNLQLPSKEISQIFKLISTQKLLEIQKQIVTQYQRVSQQIKKSAINYDFQMSKHDQLNLKLETLNIKICKETQRYCHENGLKFIISSETKEYIREKLKTFYQKLKILFIFLQYISKSLNYPQNKQNCKPKSTQNTSKFYVQKSNSSFQAINMKIPSNQNFNQKNQQQTLSSLTKNYISKLLSIYQTLLNEQILEEINQNIFYQLQKDIQKWFQIIKMQKSNHNLLAIPKVQYKQQNFPKSKRRSTSRLRESRISVFILPKTTKQLEEEQKSQVIEEDKFHNHMHMLFQLKKRKQLSMIQNHTLSSFHSRLHKQKSKSKNQLQESSQDLIYNSNKQAIKHKTEHFNEMKAQRVDLLQKVDKNYYKMLKSTLMMEKENTKKNYIFQRNFKRDKYSPRNQILEQRRFQCNFSITFTKNSNKSLKNNLNETKNTGFSKTSYFEKRISKLNGFNSPFNKSQAQKLPDRNLSLYSNQELKDNLQNKRISFKISKSLIIKKKLNEEKQKILNLI